jgi:hypothetical protein
MRYNDMKQLLKNISPDVVVEDTDPVTRAREQAFREDAKVTQSRDFLENKFMSTWMRLGGWELVAQYKFHPTRRWRFDFANTSLMVAFEIQGGIYAAQSGHRSFEGVQRDYEKLNAATLLGWRVFQVTSKMMKDEILLRQLIDFGLKTG